MSSSVIDYAAVVVVAVVVFQDSVQWEKMGLASSLVYAQAVSILLLAIVLLRRRRQPKVLLLVGCGNVGAGIGTAFAMGEWRVITVDPSPSLVPLILRAAPHEFHAKAIEEIDDAALAQMVKASGGEIVYAAECGNRDEYKDDGKLGEANARRFEAFVRRLPANELRLRYVGGSWTRRHMTESASGDAPVVEDTSPPKADDGCNPYERAKNRACQLAKKLARERGVHITFCDWASVVPNMAPNFSVAKMVDEAISKGTISYSKGDIGRPLCHSVDAGRALLRLCESDRKAGATMKIFDVLLVPGTFTSFENFATAVHAEMGEQMEGGTACAIVAKDDNAKRNTLLQARCVSARLSALGFTPDEAAVERGLRQTAKARWASCLETEMSRSMM